MYCYGAITPHSEANGFVRPVFVRRSDEEGLFFVASLDNDNTITNFVPYTTRDYPVIKFTCSVGEKGEDGHNDYERGDISPVAFANTNDKQQQEIFVGSLENMQETLLQYLFDDERLSPEAAYLAISGIQYEKICVEKRQSIYSRYIDYLKVTAPGIVDIILKEIMEDDQEVAPLLQQSKPKKVTNVKRRTCSPIPTSDRYDFLRRYLAGYATLSKSKLYLLVSKKGSRIKQENVSRVVAEVAKLQKHE